MFYKVFLSPTVEGRGSNSPCPGRERVSYPTCTFPSPGDTQVLETLRSWRYSGPGDMQVLETLRSDFRSVFATDCDSSFTQRWRRSVPHRGGEVSTTQRRRGQYHTEEERSVPHRGDEVSTTQRRRSVPHRGDEVSTTQRR
ncbi:hypothetical protein WMY93_018085 [Mugilogobius chulae]|uniref:Uncharacterized protein n=1 Tax=Mugilogobius chulae TaxID=88201 RepID=A0AAW0NPP4_9GOBI